MEHLRQEVRRRDVRRVAEPSRHFGDGKYGKEHEPVSVLHHNSACEDECLALGQRRVSGQETGRIRDCAGRNGRGLHDRQVRHGEGHAQVVGYVQGNDL